jgi:beta-N-acetylhexosaminidase
VDLDAVIDGCLLASFRGPTAPLWLLRRLEGGLGGVCLFGDNIVDVEQTSRLTRQLRAAGGEPVVATDEEGGDVTRLEMVTGSSYPGNAALGHLDDEGLTESVAAAMGALMAQTGVTLDLAPCVDVNSNPGNPVIGVRSFGDDASLVARHGAAFVRGLHSAGVAACAKHFPGHGDTAVDSHLDLPVVGHPLDVVRSRELVPFRAVIDAGVDAVMTSHVVVSALDDTPATLSRPVLVDLLRGDLGFTGAIVTDALDMKGVSGRRSIGDAAVLALAAGADLLCLGARQDEEVLDHVHAVVVAAVAEGVIDDVRLGEAAARAGRLGSRVPGSAGVEHDTALGAFAARTALRVDGTAVVPTRGYHVVELRPPAGIAAGDVPWGPATALVAIDPATTVTVPGETDKVDAALAAAASRPLVVVTRDRHRHPWQRAQLQRLVAARPDAVVVDMGWPSGEPLPAATVITTFGASRASAGAVAELLTREDPTVG